jgi:hypothetical protein
MFFSFFSFICLHIYGRLRQMFLNNSWKDPPGSLYYPYNFEDKQIGQNYCNVNILEINGIFNLYFDIDQIDYDNVDIEQIINLISRFTQVFFKYCRLSLSIGDFFAFNLMSLLILDSLWPITTKWYVFIGCLISIQIGHCIIRIVQLWWLENCMSTLPFVVITFSVYTIFIAIISCIIQPQKVLMSSVLHKEKLN